MQQSRSQRAALYRRPTLDDPDCMPQCGSVLAHAARGGRGVHGMIQESCAEANDARAAVPTLALAMGLHGLVTNALKRGALSPAAPRGWVDLRWAKSGGQVRLVWSEHGGPPVASPSRRGFGTRLVERSLAQDLGGTVAFDPEGMTCTVDAPLTMLAAFAGITSFPRAAGGAGR